MSRPELIAILNDHQREIRERYRVVSLAVFGSTARGESTNESDVDLLVEFDGEPRFDQFMDLKFHLEDLLQCHVDLVTRAGLRDSMRDAVEREAVRVA